MGLTKKFTLLLGNQGAAAWTPASITGLQLWLDASDAATLFQESDGTTPAVSDNDVVGYWGDKSGNGKHATQVTTANKFTLKTNVQNGLPALAASSDLLVVPSLELSSFAIVCLFKATGNGLVYEHSANVTSNDGAYLYTTRGVTLNARRGGSIQNKNLSQNWGIGDVARITTYEFQGPYADQKLRINGVNQTLENGASTSNLTASSVTTAFHIGARSGVLFALTGHYMELIAISPHPGLAAIEQVEAYLNAKWAVYA